MKKITIIFISLLIILYLPATLLAAQKTITTYTWDRNIQVVAGGGGGGATGTCSSNICTVTCPSGNVVTCSPCTSSPCTCPCTAGDTDFPPVVNDQDNPSITIDPVTHAILLGNGVNDGSGAVWYGGTSPVGTCNPCTSGVCTFGLGFRTYFEFKFTTPDSSSGSTDYGDGFNFTIVNASNNDVSKRGGFPDNDAGSMGELNGYAGSGNTSSSSSLPRATSTLDGLGLEPLKMALEFDTYGNTGAMTYNGCSGGRQDNNNNNHIALMYWGQNLAGNCNASSTAGNSYPQVSFDDNIHRAGSGSTSEPYNSAASGNGSGLGGYYERARSTYNWLEDNQWHRVRIEVIRIPSTFSYQMKAWVDCESLATPYTACPSGEYVYFQDVLNPYDNSSYLPKIDRTQILTSATSFNTILFGFTLGTGGATESIQINNFAIYFPPSSISPTSAPYTYSAATGSVSVTTASTTCTWTAVSNNAWITVTGGASGTGNGTVTYSITANTGEARTGTITIAGQTFTVTQAAGPPTCTLTAGTSIVPYNGTTSLTWSVSGTATTATWITSPGGTCGSPNPAGGSCTTAAQTTAGARTYTLTVSNADGSSTCSTTFYVGCVNYTVYNNTGGTRDFRVTGSGCRRVGSGNQITTNTYRLAPGETVTRYNTTNGTCGTALGSIDYTAAMNADIEANGGDHDCSVYYNANDTVSDR